MFRGPTFARPHTAARRPNTRSSSGMYLVEALVSVLIGAILLAAVINTLSQFFRYSTTTQNQIIASNLATQVIDNARNQQFQHLIDLLGGAGTKSETLILYDYPGAPASSMFPRPLLRNESNGAGMTYGTSTKNTRFDGTVVETLTDNNPGSTNDSITVSVQVKWGDSRGNHTYKTSTIISQYGIHN